MRFAVQALNGETELDVAEAVLRKSHELGVMYHKLNVLEPVGIGTGRFYRVDAGNATMSSVIEALFASGRGIVNAAADGKFLVRLVGGRTGEIPSTVMLVGSKPPTVYRGTADPFWDRQFAK